MAKKSFRENKLVKNFIDEIPQCTIDKSGIENRCKFNFSYFDSEQKAGQDFADWNKNTGISSLENLMEKLKEYTKESLHYWQNQRIGGGGLKILEYYSNFPRKTDFKHPIFVPEDAYWARFRLGNKVRLIGFVIHPSTFNHLSEKNRLQYDTNTFYIVFLDKNHLFYKMEDE
ncbi:hypothetical protein [Proteus sp. FME41]|uniref:hypothetical protein n=1 Tax=Proteus sp. FME41 TaxID=2742608 RepID=UPI0018682E5E|nr:hypothetical protein [Proteus sp. FME41]